MGETPGFNPEMGNHNVIELAKNPLRASDEVQKLMGERKYQEAQALLNAVIDKQQGKGVSEDEEPRQEKAA